MTYLIDVFIFPSLHNNMTQVSQPAVLSRVVDGTPETGRSGEHYLPYLALLLLLDPAVGPQEPTGAQLVVVEEPPQEADDFGVVLLVGRDQQHASLQQAEVLNRSGSTFRKGAS